MTISRHDRRRNTPIWTSGTCQARGGGLRCPPLSGIIGPSSGPSSGSFPSARPGHPRSESGMKRRHFLTGAAVVGGTVAFTPLRDPARAEAGSGLALPVPSQSSGLRAPGRDFPKVGGNLGNHNHSSLRDITRSNVRRLGGAWHLNLDGGSTSGTQQSTVVAQDGVLYVHTSQQNVFAVDGRTGAIRWKTNVGTESTNMRGVGLGEGMVFTTSRANIVSALDRKT